MCGREGWGGPGFSLAVEEINPHLAGTYRKTLRGGEGVPPSRGEVEPPRNPQPAQSKFPSAVAMLEEKFDLKLWCPWTPPPTDYQNELSPHPPPTSFRNSHHRLCHDSNQQGAPFFQTGTTKLSKTELCQKTGAGICRHCAVSTTLSPQKRNGITLGRFIRMGKKQMTLTEILYSLPRTKPLSI